MKCPLLVTIGRAAIATVLASFPISAITAFTVICPNQAQNTNKQESCEIFTNVGMGEIRSDDGVTVGFTNYRTDDGLATMLLHKKFKSQKDAVQHFNHELSKAKRVTARKNKGSTAMQERAVTLLPSSDSKSMTNAIVWTVHEDFFEIISDSPVHAAELEKCMSEISESEKAKSSRD